MNRHPLRPITEEDVARFGEDGAICVRNVLDREWCERMNAAVERLLLKPGKRAREATKAGDPGRFHMNVFMWRWDPDFREFALHSPLPELGASFARRRPRLIVLRPSLHQGTGYAVGDGLASGSAVLACFGQ